MSRRGNCYDNAVAESFFSSLKSEVGERFGTHANCRHELFHYIEVFYNQERRHSAIGYVSTAKFERLSVHVSLCSVEKPSTEPGQPKAETGISLYSRGWLGGERGASQPSGDDPARHSPLRVAVRRRQRSSRRDESR